MQQNITRFRITIISSSTYMGFANQPLPHYEYPLMHALERDTQLLGNLGPRVSLDQQIGKLPLAARQARIDPFRLRGRLGRDGAAIRGFDLEIMLFVEGVDG